MEEVYFKHYIRVDTSNCVVDGWSNGALSGRTVTEDDICINEQGGYQFQLFPDGEENPPLFDGDSMAPLYRWDGDHVLWRSDKDIAAEREAWNEEQARISAMPTREDRIEAQVTFTAMMTDTLLPEEE